MDASKSGRSNKGTPSWIGLKSRWQEPLCFREKQWKLYNGYRFNDNGLYTHFFNQINPDKHIKDWLFYALYWSGYGKNFQSKLRLIGMTEWVRFKM